MFLRRYPVANCILCRLLSRQAVRYFLVAGVSHAHTCSSISK
ncbi:hypothetical protein ASAP_1546 [Asaia bogorensis]|uniref:Uncharacterized protein n=1 Tax=Asaia bogorensis TaxID=91915 RepID=A0A060QJZ1_9PROT|nr:hypothetical protein ASAP_1546 [Asaia bogorensis]